MSLFRSLAAVAALSAFGIGSAQSALIETDYLTSGDSLITSDTTSRTKASRSLISISSVC